MAQYLPHPQSVMDELLCCQNRDPLGVITENDSSISGPGLLLTEIEAIALLTKIYDFLFFPALYLPISLLPPKGWLGPSAVWVTLWRHMSPQLSLIYDPPNSLY